MRKKLLSILALLCLTGTSAWAQVDLREGDEWDEDTKTLYVNTDFEEWEMSPYRNASDIVNLVISDGVTSIGQEAFIECSGLTSVTIGNSVTSIGEFAFSYCSGLTSVTIGNSVESIGYYAFNECSKLTSITIPSSVTSIEEGAFNECSGLTSVTIGNSVTSIGEYAFEGCSVTSITIPNSVESIGDYAFCNCSGLTSVTNYAVTPQAINGNVFKNVNISSCTLYVPAESVSAYSTASVWQDFGTKSAATYTVTANLANDAYWATFYSNAGNYQAPVGTQVFAVNLTGTAIEMTEISDRIVKSGEGVVLKKTTTGSFTMTKTATTPAGDFSSNSLTGTMTVIETTGANDYYVLGGKNGAGFYKLSNTSGTIGANKAYLTYSVGGAAPAREFFLFDEATGIEMPTVEDVNADAVVYDLQGRRVVNPTKGLYIVNGKKVFINK